MSAREASGLLPVLDRKLLRDLWRLRGQALGIALIVASGVAVLCSSLAVVEALLETANAFYDRQAFAHVFARTTRAPRQLLDRIEDIEGVQAVEARIVHAATVDVSGFDEPVVGMLVSLPDGRDATMNRLRFLKGTRPRARAPSDAAISADFAEEHDLEPGDVLHALINGRRRALRVSGIALSPEYVYAMGPGTLMPDPRRFGILWMSEDALGAAFDLDGAFNDVSLTLDRSAGEDEVIHRLDALLAPYGGTGAVPRADQLSNWFVMNEIRQLRSMAGILPAIFLAVAAFLSNMVLSRLIATERAEIGLLKAFGYSNFAVGWHYSKLVLAIAGGGVLAGWLLGWWLGLWTTRVYAELFGFPVLFYRPGPQPFLLAGAVSLAASLLGAVLAARRAAALPPAEAMRPPMPGVYRTAGALTRALRHAIDQLTRILLRQLVRWPVRSGLTSLGMAASVAVLIMAFQWLDALDLMVKSTFFDQYRQDLTVTLVDPQPARVRHEFARLPGVQAVEVRRHVDARLHVGHRSRREAIVGIPPGGALEVLKDSDGVAVRIPPAGLVLSGALAKRLNVAVGGTVEVEVMEGRRPWLSLPVVAVFNTWIGTPAYMDLEALNTALRESGRIGALLLKVDAPELPRLYAELKATPVVAAVSARRSAVDNFNESIAENTMVFITIYVVFAGVMAVGVTYNSMRIALSERGRELATLRVLGFSANEVAYVLLGEAALLVLLSLPMGCLLGYGLTQAIASSFETELFRIPAVIEPATYGIAMLITLAMSALCGVVVHRRIGALDLIRVLKTRE